MFSLRTRRWWSAPRTQVIWLPKVQRSKVSIGWVLSWFGRILVALQNLAWEVWAHKLWQQHKTTFPRLLFEQQSRWSRYILTYVDQCPRHSWVVRRIPFLDDFIRMTWVYCLVKTSHAFDVFKTWRAKVERETRKAAKILHIDRGRGITVRTTSKHTSRRQGSSGRRWRQGHLSRMGWQNSRTKNYNGNGIDYVEGKRCSSGILGWGNQCGCPYS